MLKHIRSITEDSSAGAINSPFSSNCVDADSSFDGAADVIRANETRTGALNTGLPAP